VWRDRSVMVVEDDEGVRAMLSAALATELGAYTVVAHDGDEALKWARRLRPTVIVLDLGLPGLDGFEVARRLKANRRTRDVCIVAISAMTPVQATRARALEAGCDDFLPKPLRVDALLDRIHHYLRASEES
jgi:DNA-binding response OmpR family regulator